MAYYKSHLCMRRPNLGSRGRKNAKPYHFHNRQKEVRKPLDKCSVALWQFVGVVMEDIWCKFEKPWVSPDGKKTVTGRRIIRHIVTIQHFRGSVLRFIVNKDTARDLRDDESMTHGEFIEFIRERTNRTLVIKKHESGGIENISILP